MACSQLWAVQLCRGAPDTFTPDIALLCVLAQLPGVHTWSVLPAVWMMSLVT